MSIITRLLTYVKYYFDVIIDNSRCICYNTFKSRIEVFSMTHEEKALSYFSDRFHCSQSVLAAFADELGLTEEQALKLGACFGGGMRKGEVCGACTGALMVLGMKYGQHDKNDLASREKTNEMTDRFLERFKTANGSYICNDILGCDISTPEGAAFAKSHGLFTTTCCDMVASAVRILEEL